jgi:tRNA threonylcarbamoyladenosine biosynthesis protein TsaB
MEASVLLAVDTSSQWVGLALYDGDKVISEEVWQSQNHHTVELTPALAVLFRRTGISTNQLRVLAVALGPGSFTSLRIGLGVVKGLALALHLPVVGIPTLDILAQAQFVQDLPMAVVLQSGRGRLAVGWYQAAEAVGSRHPQGALREGAESAGGHDPREGASLAASNQPPAWRSLGEAKIMTVEELSQGIRKPTIVCGELTAAERQVLARKRKSVLLASPAHAVRRPAFLAELGWQRWQAGQVDDPVTLAPVYVHIGEPILEEPAKGPA